MAECSKELLPRVDGDVLIENRIELVRQITPTDILNPLLQSRVIDLDDFNNIKLEQKREGRRAGVEKLLDRIHNSGSRGLDKFINSLASSGYPSLVKQLQDSQENINRAGQNQENEGSAHRLQESRQTINSAEQQTRKAGLSGYWALSLVSICFLFNEYLVKIVCPVGSRPAIISTPLVLYDGASVYKSKECMIAEITELFRIIPNI